MNNFELYQQFRAAKSCDDILKIAEQEGKAMSAEEAQRIFDNTHGNAELTDDELQAATGGFRWPWESDSKFPPPKYHVGEHVRVHSVYSDTVGIHNALVISVSDEKKSV